MLPTRTTASRTIRQRHRDAAGMSLRELEAATGINRGLLSWWERGLHNLSPEQEAAIGDAFEAHTNRGD